MRKGGKTIVDLQSFLETHQKYKDEYGILPTLENSNKSKEKETKERAMTEREKKDREKE